jgi:hypothetical protein
MRRVRHLDCSDYLITIKQKTGQLLTMSNCHNVLLERTWHRQSREDLSLKVHAKFNADTMNGLQIMASVYRGSKIKSSSVTGVTVYRVAVDTWTETFVHSNGMTESSPGVFTLDVNQTALGANELSGLETYAIVVTAIRGRRKFTEKIWVNHLGSFDSINRLQKEVNYLHSTKLDE